MEKLKIPPEVFDFYLVEKSKISAFGKRIYFRVRRKEYLSAVIVKSDTATFRLLELDLEVPEGNGRCITILEFLSQSRLEMEKSRISSNEGDGLDEFLTKLQKLESGETPFTIELDDPLARSWIEFTEILQNEEQSLITEEYQRTRKQDEEYDLEHEIRFPFITDGEYEIPPFEVAHEDGLPFKQYQALYDVEIWYQSIRPFTFETIFLPLEIEEAQCIISNYEKQNSNSLVEEKLIQRIDETIRKFKNGAIIRLSTRSPKDAIQKSEEFKNLFKMELSQYKNPDGNTSDIVWYSCNVKSMKLLSGKHAFNLLSASTRAFDDLGRWIEFPEFKMNLIVREYHYIDPSMLVNVQKEFRCFVHDGVLTAVSQYITVCYFENLKQTKNKVKEIIRNFFEKAKDSLAKLYKSYVFDLAIMEDETVLIIEVNPFWNKTGPALFNWQEDRDLIAKGNKDGDFEFRIVEYEWMRKKNYLVDVRQGVVEV